MKRCRTAEVPNCRKGEQWPVASSQWPVLRGWKLLLATLREIFDESAYARFLTRSGMEPSRASYRAFLRENGVARERRPRCC